MDGELALDYILSKIAAPEKPTTVKSSPEDRTALRSKEIEMWKAWKDSGHHPELLNPLFKSFSGLIKQRVNKYRGAEVPTAAVEMNVKKEFVNGLKSYDPSKGTTLATHVNNTMMKATRFVDNNKNAARVSSHIGEKIGYFNSVKSSLADKLGHEPDAQAIHDHLLLEPHEHLGSPSLKQIIRFNKDQRKALFESSGNPLDLMGKRTTLSGIDPREEEVIRLIVPMLTPEERSVHEYLYGLNGKPELKKGEIAKRMGWDAPKVSKTVDKIRKKVLEYL